MRFSSISRFALLLAVLMLLGRNVPAVHASEPARLPRVLAVETFLADIAQNVAGTRLKVAALIPLGVDPHEFEPSPADIRRLADCDVLILNGAGLEEALERILKNAGGERITVVATAGLKSRDANPGETAEADAANAHGEGDRNPHLWLDPVLVQGYVENIRAGLAKADPAGAELYARNAAAYAGKLRELDAWIREQFAPLPLARRLLVTNHESLGYFADRYGFRVVGSIIPSVSSSASPSARQMADLIRHVRAAKAPAVFLETGTNPQMARQLAAETGVKVVTDLYTHSITAPDGPAPSYIEMMKADTRAIAAALK